MSGRLSLEDIRFLATNGVIRIKDIITSCQMIGKDKAPHNTLIIQQWQEAASRKRKAFKTDRKREVTGMKNQTERKELVADRQGI